MNYYHSGADAAITFKKKNTTESSLVKITTKLTLDLARKLSTRLYSINSIRLYSINAKKNNKFLCTFITFFNTNRFLILFNRNIKYTFIWFQKHFKAKLIYEFAKAKLSTTIGNWVKKKILISGKILFKYIY